MKPSPKRTFDAEHILTKIRNQLKPHIYDGLQLSKHDVFGLIGELERASDDLRAMANELSQQRWNNSVTEDEFINQVIEQAYDGNIVLFPVFPRMVPANALQNRIRFERNDTKPNEELSQ